MSQTIAILAFFGVVVILGLGMASVVESFARKRGWSRNLTRFARVFVLVAGPVGLLYWILDVRLAVVLPVAISVLVTGYIYLYGMEGWVEYFRRRRGESNEDR